MHPQTNIFNQNPTINGGKINEITIPTQKDKQVTHEIIFFNNEYLKYLSIKSLNH